MLLDGQKIELKWSGSNKRWFIDKGYNFTKLNNKFFVNANDLMKTSKIKVWVQCDYCDQIYQTNYSTYHSGHVINNKDACKHCAAKKASELHKIKRAKEAYSQAINLCNKYGYKMISTLEDFFNYNFKDFKMKGTK